MRANSSRQAGGSRPWTSPSSGPATSAARSPRHSSAPVTPSRSPRATRRMPGPLPARPGRPSSPRTVRPRRPHPIVVLAVPFSSAADIAAEIGDAVAGKVVIDATNRMSFGANGPDIDTTTSNAEELAALLPGAIVVKAFNTLFASQPERPDHRRRPARRLRRGRRRGCPCHRPRARRVDRAATCRRRSARPSSPARRSGLPEHHAQHRQRRQLAVRLEARRRAGRRACRCLRQNARHEHPRLEPESRGAVRP